ncbi:hypothetical protein ACFYMB_11035 [Micromonospora haikouensis]|uniref:hypothetical protein n=1 Tax=Micromonospora haikouensis TaxID=686309 RepID=UPI00367FAFBE
MATEQRKLHSGCQGSEAPDPAKMQRLTEITLERSGISIWTESDVFIVSDTQLAFNWAVARQP